jgi:hypothetical protein
MDVRGRYDARPGVDVRGEFRAVGARTRVAGVMRQGRLLVTFAWLLLVLAVPWVSASGGGRAGHVSPATGARLVLAFAALWYLKLWWDIRRAGQVRGPADPAG